jgi:hypothetical protein
MPSPDDQCPLAGRLLWSLKARVLRKPWEHKLAQDLRKLALALPNLKDDPVTSVQVEESARRDSRHECVRPPGFLAVLVKHQLAIKPATAGLLPDWPAARRVWELAFAYACKSALLACGLPIRGLCSFPSR